MTALVYGISNEISDKVQTFTMSRGKMPLISHAIGPHFFYRWHGEGQNALMFMKRSDIKVKCSKGLKVSVAARIDGKTWFGQFERGKAPRWLPA